MKFVRDVWPTRANEIGRIVMRRMLSFATGRIVHMKLGVQDNRTLTIRRITMRPTPFVSKDF
jgi:hypothetical protein